MNEITIPSTYGQLYYDQPYKRIERRGYVMYAVGGHLVHEGKVYWIEDIVPNFETKEWLFKVEKPKGGDK